MGALASADRFPAAPAPLFDAACRAIRAVKPRTLRLDEVNRLQGVERPGRLQNSFEIAVRQRLLRSMQATMLSRLF
jgi:hypothetical protein